MNRTSHASGHFLAEILALDCLVDVVDVGANPIDGDPPYKALFEWGLASITGFEPQEKALQDLLKNKRANEYYYPYVIGNGDVVTLNIYSGYGLASTLELDPATLDIFRHLKHLSTLLGKFSIQSIRLDDVAEIRRMDFLKIDIQGGELAVFRGARQRLIDAVCIQTEVSFVTLYKNQPSIGEIDLELRSQGFIPHCFAGPINTGPVFPAIIDGLPAKGLNQLGEADIVYVKDFRRPELFSDEALKKLALIAHHCYGSVDLVARCLSILMKRGHIGELAISQYLSACSGAFYVHGE